MRHVQENHQHTKQLEKVVTTAARDMAPEITLYGLAEPRIVKINPRRFSRALKIRLEVERATADYYREKDRGLASWSFSNGLYSEWDSGWDQTIAINEHPLIGPEADMAQNIDRLLVGRGSDKPTVVLDFGGGMGLTWMRIASQPQHKAAIEEGRLALAVTNLGTSLDTSPDSDGFWGVAGSMNQINKRYGSDGSPNDYTDEDLEWAQEHQKYMHYLDANALELPDHSITTPNGEHVPLTGNVGLIHERLSLEHTHVPDLALAGFSTMLSDQGTLYSEAARSYHLVHPAQFSAVTLRSGKDVLMDREYSNQRDLALAIGSKMLLLHGFSYQQDEKTRRGIFSRQLIAT